MRKPVIGLVPALALAAACTTLTPDGAKVKVYEASLKAADAPAPPMPDGCKRLGSWGPITEQTQERHIDDPYRSQRNETAERGGNVLLVKSYRFMDKKRTDCSMGDTSPDCVNTAQNWYKTSFDAFACDAPALQALSELKPAESEPALLTLLLPGKKKTEPTPAPAAPAAASATGAAASAPPPAAASTAPSAAATATTAAPAPGAKATTLKTKILALMQEGVGEDVILAYVRANRLPYALTAEEIIDWKKSGISDAVIRAAFPS